MLKQKFSNPGPGHYTSEFRIQGNRAIHTTHDSQSSSRRDRRNASDAFLTSTKRNTLHITKDQMLSPGPAQYNGRGDDLYTRMLKKRSIHATVREVIQNSGSLGHISYRNSFSMSRKGSEERLLKSASQITIPGPADYRIEQSLASIEKNKIAAGFVKAKRFDLKSDRSQREGSPGPQEYVRETSFDSTHRIMPKVSFTKEDRFKNAKLKQKSPSPQHYNIKQEGRVKLCVPFQLTSQSGTVLDEL